MSKIGFIGVAIKKSIALHGFALNVAPDLSFFQMIHSCGLKDVTITSMKVLLGRPVTIEEVKGHIVFHFKNIFGLSINEMAKDLSFSNIYNTS